MCPANPPATPVSAPFSSPVIALLTDFQPGEVYVGVLHGVLASLAPGARVIDLCHAIAPGDVAAAGVMLEATIDYFPAPTVFCCVVDPGVGTDRRAIAATDGRHFYIAPDNGLLSLIEEHAADFHLPWRAWEIRTEKLGRSPDAPPPSATFHGRDIFAPAAARVALGGQAALESLGPEIREMVAIDYTHYSAEASRGAMDMTVMALCCDAFGNVITSLKKRDWEEFWRKNGPTVFPQGECECAWPEPGEIAVSAGGARWNGIVETFADVAPGEPLAYWGSGGRLEIAVRDGNAVESLSIAQGDTIRLKYRRKKSGERAGARARSKPAPNRAKPR